MNIKKIIREEIENTWGWTEDIKPMTPQMLWLKDNFSNLTEVIKDDKVYYVDSERKPLFMYYQNQKKGNIYINYHRIWSKLEDNFGLNYDGIEELITEWLVRTYDLMGFTPQLGFFVLDKDWDRPII